MKKILTALLTIILLFSACSCAYLYPHINNEKIEGHEWHLIYAEFSSTYPNVSAADPDGNLIYGEDFLHVEITLTANDGKITLTNELTGEVIDGEYSYANNRNTKNPQLSISFGDLHGYGSVCVSEYVDFNTEITGFDGTKYGKYMLSIILDDYYLTFFAD